VPETPPLFACLPPEGAGPDAALEGFLRYVETLGLTLYPHQEEAILALMNGTHVIVHTPTGSRKSLIATARDSADDFGFGFWATASSWSSRAPCFAVPRPRNARARHDAMPLDRGPSGRKRRSRRGR
jgi:hypothetical protein